MTLKIGNKVKIKNNLQCKMIGNVYFMDGMKIYEGKTAIITSIDKNYVGSNKEAYHIDIDKEGTRDGVGWWWSEEMFEKQKPSMKELME
jgi:hypothetical protein